VSETKNLCFGDLVLDETCLFARRNGETIQFTRNERALLLAFTRNPRRLMRRSRLLDEIASSESGSSDRYIDFLVNQLRIKLGDNAKSPMYIATQYGEGYVWIASASSADSIAAPSSPAPKNAFLAIAPVLGPSEHRFSRQASSLIDQLRDMIAAGVGAGRKVVIAGDGVPAATGRLNYLLQVSFHAEGGRVNCAANLREMPSKRIVKAFGLPLGIANDASLTSNAARVSTGVIGAVRQALADASTGLGTPIDAPPETRLQNATSLLSVSNAKWLASGEQLRGELEQNPFNADTALQWCLHLFARLVMTNPFNGASLEERYRIESEIEARVLECLPAIEANPVLNLAAAKLLYFINRGHLELAEDLAECAFARTSRPPCRSWGNCAARAETSMMRLFSSIAGSRCPILPPALFCICGS
jgi:DNA-binding winged helix-turn-helix (wHTH) protein